MLLVIMPYLNDYLQSTKFDSEKWILSQKETESNEQLRWSMRRDLLKNYHLKEKSKEEIFKLLGKLTNEFGNKIYYNLGPATIGINMGTLEIEFQNNKVKIYRIFSG